MNQTAEVVCQMSEKKSFSLSVCRFVCVEQWFGAIYQISERNDVVYTMCKLNHLDPCFWTCITDLLWSIALNPIVCMQRKHLHQKTLYVLLVLLLPLNFNVHSFIYLVIHSFQTINAHSNMLAYMHGWWILAHIHGSPTSQPMKIIYSHCEWCVI